MRAVSLNESSQEFLVDAADQILLQLSEIRTENQGMRQEVIKTSVELKSHRSDFRAHCDKFEPVYQQHIHNQMNKLARQDKLKTWSWKFGIVAGIVTIATAIITWSVA